MSEADGSAQFVSLEIDAAAKGPISPAERGIAWLGLCYQVQSRSKLDTFRRTPHHMPKQILRDVSGFVRSGEMLFIMGPSGSGKTSTLDTLAMRVKGDVQGQVWLDGRVCNEKRFRASAKYVKQNSSLFESLTTYETLMVRS
jgi:ABC-type multidrug transport system ATPase subunit